MTRHRDHGLQRAGTDVRDALTGVCVRSAPIAPRRGAARSAADGSGGPGPVDVRPRLSVVMPTVGWSGTFEPCARRCLHLVDVLAGGAEFVVVLDGTATEPPEWLDRPHVTVVASDARRGPAQARNVAAAAADGLA